jgi:amino acid transporter
VAADATIVLAAGVLTAYVGVVGLLKRLASDRCIPHLFLATNAWRKTNHVIIITFFVACSSLILLLDGSIAEVCVLGWGGRRCAGPV